MAVPWATPEDVFDAWIGEGAPDDEAIVETWIGKATREVKYRVPGIQARIDAEAAETPARTDLLDLAIDVVVAMVIRVFRNPEGIRQRNITTGPFTGSETYGGDVPGGLALTDDELAKLRGQRVTGAFTIDMIPPSSPFYGGGYASPYL